MNKKFVIFAVGKLLEIIAFILLIPASIAFVEIKASNFLAAVFDYRLLGFIIAIITSFSVGNVLKLIGNRQLKGIGVKEGFAIVTFGWVLR